MNTKNVKNLILVLVCTLGILASMRLEGGNYSFVYTENDPFKHESHAKKQND